MLTEPERAEIEEKLRHARTARAVNIDALKIVQRHRGYVSDEALHDLSGHLGRSVDELEGVATFYSLIFRRPVGRHLLLLCDSASCWMLGCDGLRRHLESAHGLSLGGTTEDHRFTLLPSACLGACDGAPALMIDHTLHRNLDRGRLDELLDRCR